MGTMPFCKRQADAITVMSLGIPQPHGYVGQCPHLGSDVQPQSSMPPLAVVPSPTGGCSTWEGQFSAPWSNVHVCELQMMPGPVD